MKFLSKSGVKIFNKIIESLEKPGESRKIDNSKGVYMPVHVEYIANTFHGDLFSVAHYYTQNGDLVPDPEMTFLKKHTDYILPLEINNSVGNVCGAYIDEKGTLCVYPKAQSDMATFAAQWMRKIKQQQLGRARRQ